MTRIRLAAVAVLGLGILPGTASAQSKDDPALGSWKLNVAADGKTMTIEQKTTDASGRPVVNVELFERQ